MKKLLAILLALAMVFSLVACGSTSSGTTATDNDSSSQTDDANTTDTTTDTTDTDADTDADASGEAGALTGTLKVGMIGPLTGGAALYGVAVSNASQIAVDEINALSDSFQIELNSQDDEHDPEKSVNAYNSLKDWGAQVIDGCVTTAPCVAVSSEAYSDRMFMLTPSASSTDVTNGKDNMFQLCFSDPNQGTAAAQYISENNLSEKIAIIYNNGDAYSTGIYQTFQAEADELGLNIVSVTTFTDDSATDFSVQLKAAQDAGADLIFLPIYYTPASLIMQQASNMDYAVQYFGVDGMDGILTLENFDTSLAEGVMLLTPFAADATDDATVSFVTKYQEQYGETPSQFAADGYDVVYALYSALSYYAQNNGGLDVTGMTYSDLCEIFISVFTDANFTYSGLTGANMTWSANGEVSKAPQAVKIENGVYVGM
jgi:branched-chain amino acid transport system substrate-binding protein